MVSVLSFFIVTFPSLNKVLWQDLISMHSFSLFMQYHIDGEHGDDLLDHVWKKKGEFSSPCLFILQMRRYWESIKIYKPWKLCKWEERYLLPSLCMFHILPEPYIYDTIRIVFLSFYDWNSSIASILHGHVFQMHSQLHCLVHLISFLGPL